MNHRIVAVLVMTVWAAIAGFNLETACADQLYAENFNSMKTGQSLAGKETGWSLHSPGDGLIMIGTGDHGWSGSFIDGSTSTEGASTIMLRAFGPACNSICTLSCMAYAKGSEGSSIGLAPSGAWGDIRCQWTTSKDGWRFYVGHGGERFDETGFVGGHDTSINLRINVDLVARKAWGEAVWRGAQGQMHNFNTPKYDWTSSKFDAGNLWLCEDRRNGRTGIDIGDITIEGNVWKQPESSGWNLDHIWRLNGKSAVKLPAKFQLFTEGWNRRVLQPYMVYMPENKRLLMSFSVEGHVMLTSSDDMGKTWSKIRRLADNDEKEIGDGLGLTYLGKGKLFLQRYSDTRIVSNDYGQSWPQTLSIPSTPDGKPLYQWDPLLVDKDEKTGKITRLMQGGWSPTGIPLGSASGKYAQAYAAFSSDEGLSWNKVIKVPEWYGSSEMTFVRAKNGDIVAACRLDNEDRFLKENDEYGGMGISISKDNGYTWSAVKPLFTWGRHHASMVLMPNGAIVMTYIVRRGYPATSDGYPQFGIEAVVSRDNGRTWDLDHRYILTTWSGKIKGSLGWYGDPQNSSSVLLPDGSILTAYGTGCNVKSTEGYFPRDIGLIQWRMNNKGFISSNSIAKSASDSDLRNEFDPATLNGGIKHSEGRKNIAVPNAGARVTASTCDKDPQLIIDPYHTYAELILQTSPSWIEMRWPVAHLIDEIVIYGGEPEYAKMKSTECTPLDYRLQYIKDGNWVDLVPPVRNAPRYSEYQKTGEPSWEFRYNHKFPPVYTGAVRIYIERSSDEGLRSSSPEVAPLEKRSTIIRSIEIYESNSK